VSLIDEGDGDPHNAKEMESSKREPKERKRTPDD